MRALADVSRKVVVVARRDRPVTSGGREAKIHISRVDHVVEDREFETDCLPAPAVVFRPVNDVNNPLVIARQPHLFSLNSAHPHHREALLQQATDAGLLPYGSSVSMRNCPKGLIHYRA